MRKAALEKLRDLYQDVLQGIEADLETGSHHFNNAAHKEFYERHQFMHAALGKLNAYIEGELALEVSLMREKSPEKGSTNGNADT